MRVNYAIVFVSDMSRSVAFYRDVVGIPLKFESPEWTEFVTEGATLALHLAKRSVDDGDPLETPAGHCKAGFEVPDLDVFHASMMQNFVDCIQTPKDVHGSKIAQYLDPDGLAFSVSEERKG